ncbi:MAG TPA: ABC transporter ATP-binding protein [Cyclobacteriaceae bacterium]|jgi:ABC-type bacteriocin/lantibiotic exporter with double-glycine peptidase domain
MMKENAFFRGLKLIPRARRKTGAFIVALLFLNSILDFFSLAFFLPIIFLLIDPERVQANPSFQRAYEAGGFDSLNAFAIAFTAAVFLFIVLKTLMNAWVIRAKARYAYSVATAIASRVISRYLAQPYQKFTESTLSHEVNVMASIPLVFANNILVPAGTVLSEGLVFLLLLAGVMVYDVKIFGFLSIILLPAFLVFRLRRIHLRRIGGTIRASWSNLLRRALVIAEGFPDIKAFQKESFFRDTFRELSEKHGRALALDHAAHAGTPRVTEVIAAACVSGLIIYVLSAQNDSQNTLILLSIYAAASFRIIPSISRITVAVQQMRINEYCLQELDNVVDKQEERQPDTTPTRPPFNSSIRLKDISFAYAKQLPLLANVNLIIRNGETVALTGRSGSGKSSLLLIILGFLKQQAGTILIDDLPVSDEERARLLGYVPQSPYIMDGSVMENIAFGVPAPQVDREKVSRLVEGMGLSAWVASLPEGLETRIGEKGAKISGGQRQRIAIARALYRDADILLLDEVTNQLDPETENEVITTLLDVTEHSKTILMITHHPELLKKFDTVYELVDGQLRKVSDEQYSPKKRHAG